jgi:ubiquinone/menaquinone biosynthesis C-methylase UbiE
MTEPQAAKVKAQFGAAAEAYVTCAGFAAGDDLAQLTTWGRAARPDRVLDLATGGGHTALAFSALARAVVAIDLTEPMLRAAARHVRAAGAANVDFLAGEAERLPLRDGVFDVVTCRIAPHHFTDVPAAVREVARVLRRGGLFLLADILGHDDRDAAAFITAVERARDPSHVRAYRAGEWAAYLETAKLTMTDHGTVRRVRAWGEWTGMMRMTPADKARLEQFVLDAPAAHRAPFEFKFTGGRIESFSDGVIVLRARKG